jgi:hypothetical protein
MSYCLGIDNKSDSAVFLAGIIFSPVVSAKIFRPFELYLNFSCKQLLILVCSKYILISVN